MEAFLGGLALPLPCFCPLPCCCPLAGLEDGPDGLPGPRARGGGAFLTFLLLRGMTEGEEKGVHFQKGSYMNLYETNTELSPVSATGR